MLTPHHKSAAASVQHHARQGACPGHGECQWHAQGLQERRLAPRGRYTGSCRSPLPLLHPARPQLYRVPHPCSPAWLQRLGRCCRWRPQGLWQRTQPARALRCCGSARGARQAAGRAHHHERPGAALHHRGAPGAHQVAGHQRLPGEAGAPRIAHSRDCTRLFARCPCARTRLSQPAPHVQTALPPAVACCTPVTKQPDPGQQLGGVSSMSRHTVVPAPGVGVCVTRRCVLLQVLPLLKTGTQAWQPSDFLPESSDPDFEDQVCRAAAAGVSWAGSVTRGSTRRGTCCCSRRQPAVLEQGLMTGQGDDGARRGQGWRREPSTPPGSRGGGVVLLATCPALG
jgi:hypothetical protein